MQEEEIAQNLKANIPQAEEFTPAAKPPTDTSYGQATTDVHHELDEITQYRLQDYFDVRYRQTDEASRQQIQYIYDSVSKMVDEQDYSLVLAKIRDLERIIGTTNSERRVYKLYQWLKLDSMRRNIDAQMGAITQ